MTENLSFLVMPSAYTRKRIILSMASVDPLKHISDHAEGFMSSRLIPILMSVLLKMRSTELPMSTRTLVTVQSLIPMSTRSESLCGMWMHAASSAEKVLGGLPSGVLGQRLAVIAFRQKAFTVLTESLPGGSSHDHVQALKLLLILFLGSCSSLGPEGIETRTQVLSLALIRDDRLWLCFGTVGLASFEFFAKIRDLRVELNSEISCLDTIRLTV